MPVPTEIKWAGRQADRHTRRWDASAVTSRFVGPIDAPCSLPFRAFALFRLANERPVWSGGRTTFEKSSMAPNSRCPYPCYLDFVQVRLLLGGREEQEVESSTFLIVAQPLPSLCQSNNRPFCHSCQPSQPDVPARSTERITDERTEPPPRFHRQVSSSTHYVSPLICMAITSVDPPNSSSLRPIGSQYPLPILRIQSSGQSTSQTIPQRIFLTPSLHLFPQV